jgi:alkylation response protein AidB-like acyl-CoA dehydrogenase
MVQNCDLTFDNVLVDKSQKLEKGNSFFYTGNGFGDATSRVLRHSRVFACWIAVGIGMGVYDTVIDYSIKRKQFSSEIACKYSIYKSFSNDSIKDSKNYV